MEFIRFVLNLKGKKKMSKLEEFIEELEKLLTVDIAHPYNRFLFMIDQKKYVELKNRYIKEEDNEDKV